LEHRRITNVFQKIIIAHRILSVTTNSTSLYPALLDGAITDSPYLLRVR
jgi:hypothetical protein